MKKFCQFIESESIEIKNKVNEILNHPLIEEKWINPDKRDFECSDGGTIDMRDDYIKFSVHGVSYLVKKLLKHRPQKIMEIGTNAGSFSIICKLVLDNIKIYTIDRQIEFQKRVEQINNFFEENFILFYNGDSQSNEYRNWISKFKPFDVAWIDGNHSTDCVKHDIETALLNKVPSIWCDDYGIELFNDVYPVVNQMVDKKIVSIVEDSQIINNDVISTHTVGSFVILKNENKIK